MAAGKGQQPKEDVTGEKVTGDGTQPGMVLTGDGMQPGMVQTGICNDREKRYRDTPDRKSPTGDCVPSAQKVCFNSLQFGFHHGKKMYRPKDILWRLQLSRRKKEAICQPK